jgi:hypothetical protein
MAGTGWRVAAVIAGLTLAACNGGGDGQAGVTYSGATTQATVTGSNAVAITTTAYQGGNASGSLALVGAAVNAADGSGAGAGGGRALTVSRVLEHAVRTARLGSPPPARVAAGATVTVSDNLDPGTCGGSASYSGTANDVTGAFSATFTFSGWCNDGVTVSGTVTASGQVDLSGQTPELVTLDFSFTVLTVSEGDDTFSGSGTISLDLGTTDSLTVDMDFQSSDGKVYRASNFVLTVLETGGDDSLTVEGRLYHPDHGYVDVTTPVPFVVASGDSTPSSGQLVVTGSNDCRARLTVLSSAMFQVEIDVDGDGTYESTLGPFNWTDV